MYYALTAKSLVKLHWCSKHGVEFGGYTDKWIGESYYFLMTGYYR